jgi:hypothetical protein
MKRRRILLIAPAFALAWSASALAGGPLRGKTYEGSVPSLGTESEGHRVPTHASGKIVLRVSANGRSVSVRFSSTAPVLYCSTQQRLHSQSTHAASISGSGRFKAKVAQRFHAGPGEAAITQVVTGTFSGRTVKGTIHTQTAPECSGVASFTATAR